MPDIHNRDRPSWCRVHDAVSENDIVFGGGNGLQGLRDVSIPDVGGLLDGDVLGIGNNFGM
jgi:hypothetical protein